MLPSHEFPGNIVYYVALAIGLGFFAYSVSTKVRIFARGKGDNRFYNPIERLTSLVPYLLGNARVARPQYWYSGLLHTLIYWGFIVLQIRTINFLLAGFDETWAPDYWADTAYDLLIRAPDDYKLRDGWTKYCFRRAAEPVLPSSIAWRKDKQGFSNPEGEWLKHELRDAVRAAFAPDSLIARKGIIDSAAMLRRYELYARQPALGGSIWYREILAPLSLELWMRRFAQWIE